MRRLFVLVVLVASSFALACTTNGDPPPRAATEPAAASTAEPTEPPPSIPLPESGAISEGRDADVADVAADAEEPLDAGRDADSLNTQRACVDYARPTTHAACRGCPAGRTCQPNGCWGSYWCEVPVLRCVPPPPGC